MRLGLGLGMRSTRRAPSPVVDLSPTFVAASTASAASHTCTPAPPAGIEAGDVLVAFNRCTGGVVAVMSGGDGGWTPVTGSGADFRVFHRVATGSEPSTYTARDVDNDGTAIRSTIVAYRPAPGTTLTVTGSVGSSGAGTNHTTPLLTPGGDDAMILAAASSTSAVSWTAPAAMTERADNATDVSVAVFDVVLDVAAEISKTAVSSGSASALMAIVALTPA